MKKWIVEMPIAGSVTIRVEAETEEEAIEAASERMEEGGECWDFLTWEYATELYTESGQFHGPLERAQAEADE